MTRSLLCVAISCSMAAVTVCTFAQQRVGINTITPTSTLDVVGTIKTDSIIIPSTHYYAYATAKPDTLMLAPAEFLRGGTTSGYIIYNVNGAEIHFDGTPSAVIGYCVAPLSLPNGAHITNVTAYVVDESPQSITVALYETDVNTGVNSQVGNAATTATSPAIVAVSFAASYTVDNATKTNAIKVVLGNDATALSKLYGVRVIYTVGHVN